MIEAPSIKEKIPVEKQLKVKYIKRRVHHTSPKFGASLIKSETDTTVIISFDNGTTTTFTKESFGKGEE